MSPLDTQLLVQTGAHRELLIYLYAHKFLAEPDPIGSIKTFQKMLAGLPTVPPRQGTEMDPAMSDLLAAMTDEAIEDFMGRVVERLEALLGLGSAVS